MSNKKAGKLSTSTKGSTTSPVISAKQLISNEKFLKELLNDNFIACGCELHSKEDFTDKQISEINQKIWSSTYSDDIERGTAMFPLYSNNWSIGGFGSIWVDFQIPDGTKIRCSLYHKRDTQNKTAHILYVQIIGV